MIGDRITRVYVALLLLAMVFGGVLASIHNGMPASQPASQPASCVGL